MSQIGDVSIASANRGGRLKSVRWIRPVIVLFLITLVIVSLGTTSAALAAPRAQSILLQMAAEQPEEMVGIIVQQTVRDASVQDLVTRLGGKVTMDLHIINAFAAKMPAKAVPQLAKADGVRWVSFDAPVNRSGTIQQVFTTWATKIGHYAPTTFQNATNVLSPAGPDGSYAAASNNLGDYGGFSGSYTPGFGITRIEAALRVYAPKKLNPKATLSLMPVVNGKPGRPVYVPLGTSNPYTSPATAGTVYVDITASRQWQWSDFLGDPQLVINQTHLGAGQVIYYDAVGLRVTTTEGQQDASTPLRRVIGRGGPARRPNTAADGNSGPIDISHLVNVFNNVVRATDVWNEDPNYYQGQGVTVAIVDSGVFDTGAWGSRMVGQVNFDPNYSDAIDKFGHGTFTAAVVGDGGALSNGWYMGVAPQVNLVSVRISDDNGVSTMSQVVNGLQWIQANAATYNIKVVNLSLNSSAYDSYMVDPLDAACEILWFDGITVVVSAGNNGTATDFPPANDPFVITVGATDDSGTKSLQDDGVASFSAWGLDDNGNPKPDLVAPGTNLIAYMPDNPYLTIGVKHPANRQDPNYFRMSGTSFAAPIVAGGAAILLQSNPSLTPDQVKSQLMATANKNWPGYNPASAGAGLLDIYAAVHGTSTSPANTGITASQLLWTGSTPVTWSSVNWSSVNWSSVNWSSVNWSSVNWSSVNWSSDYFGPMKKR